jgi:hypothetical protein
MITSVYEDLFTALLRGQVVRVPVNSINIQSIRVQWIRFRDAQFAADWLVGKVLDFTPIPGNTTDIDICLRTSKRLKSIPFQIVSTTEVPDAKQTLPTDLAADKTG